MSSYLEEAEKAVSRCRRVYTGDIIMADDVNCLFDTAYNIVQYLKEFKPGAKPDITDVINRMFGEYHYDKTGGRFAWYNESLQNNGVILLSGDEADQIEIEMPFHVRPRCSGIEFGYVAILSKGRVKLVPLFVYQSVSLKFSNPEIIMLVKYADGVRVRATGNEVVYVPNMITVSLKREGNTVKEYDIGILGMNAGGAYPVDMTYIWRDIYVYVPYIPYRWYFVGASVDVYQYQIACISALDSEDINDADVIKSSCSDVLGYISMYIEPTTPAIAVFGRSDYPMVLPYPGLTPDKEGTISDIVCGWI